MTYEFRKIVEAYRRARDKGLRAALATVVALDGSSYRRPGVRMLIREDGKMTGVLSGGCVENEVRRRAQGVIDTGIPKMMTYDGRFRLGCEGILYILIEPFEPNEQFLQTVKGHLEQRNNFTITSWFERTDDRADPGFGSVLISGTSRFPVRAAFQENAALETFEQLMEPCQQLIIFGAEHDAVQLCSFAALAGWEVTVVADPVEEKELADFPGAHKLLQVEPEAFADDCIDKHTAVMLMSHNYAKDLRFLLQIRNTRPVYLGLLGPAKRRERILEEVMQRFPDVDYEFFERIHAPAGLNIGGETAQEIAVAIIAEILAVIRDQDPILLKNKRGDIHA